jgi:GNAT superfamily N-acetyltransferase
MSVTVRFDGRPRVDEWLALYKACGYNHWWTERNAQAALAYAYLVATAWDRERAVATLTVWSDGVNFALIDDVAVHPDHRGRGIGSLLVTEALSRLRNAAITSVQVLPIPGREPFFARLGFVAQSNATVMDRAIHSSDPPSPDRDVRPQESQ